MTNHIQSETNDWTITFCVVGSACSNSRLLTALTDRYVYECIEDERDVLQSFNETKYFLTQRQLRIYILDSFDDRLFRLLKENDEIYSISSELVLSCAEKQVDIPVPRRNRPLYCQHLSSAVICFVGIRKEIHTEFSEFVHFLGGSVRKDYSDQVTHVVSHANLGEKYLTAFNMERSEILTEDWLLRCWNERDNRTFDPFDPELIRYYRAKPLHNLHLFFYGFHDENDIEHFQSLTVENGGFVTNDLNEATHIIIDDFNGFLTEYPSYTRKHRQYVVHVQWFWECLCLMGKADESIYSVNLTGPTLISTPDSSLIVTNESPLLDTSLNTTVKRKRRQKHSICQSKRFNSENIDQDEEILMKKQDQKYLIGLELRETEGNYVRMLENLIRIFKIEMEKDDRRNGPILTKVESSQIFGNIEEIYQLHSSIVEQLDRALRDDECIGTVFLANSVELLRVYQPYTKFYDKTIEAIHNLEKNNSRFYAYLKICEHKSELGKQHLADLMIRPIQRLPSILLLLERLLKYTARTHVDYQLLIDSLEKLREIAKKLNDERGKTEKHLSLFNIVNSIENCPPELLAAHRDFIDKFQVIELSHELTSTRTNLTIFLFSDCLEIAKCRVNTWKTAAIKGSKSFKHLVLISLSDIRSLIEMSSFNLDAAEQFGILCSVDGQLRQLVFRVTNKNVQSRIDLIDLLAKAISDDRCLLDKSSLIQHSTNDQQLYSSQTSLENSEIDSSTRSTSSLNLFGLALKRGLHKANKRLTRAFSFSPESNRYLTKKLLSPLHYLQDEWSHSFDSSQRMNNSSRQESFLTTMNSSSPFMQSIQEH